MTRAQVSTIALIALLTTLPAPALAGDVILSGTVTSAVTPEQRKFYETFVAPDFNAPFAWAQGSRRLGADKDGDYVWVGNSFGGTLGRIDIRTKEIKLVPLANPEVHQPYQVQVDSKHNVWTNLWSTDKVARYDPGQWAMDLVRPSEPRH